MTALAGLPTEAGIRKARRVAEIARTMADLNEKLLTLAADEGSYRALEEECGPILAAAILDATMGANLLGDNPTSLDVPRRDADRIDAVLESVDGARNTAALTS